MQSDKYIPIITKEQNANKVTPGGPKYMKANIYIMTISPDIKAKCARWNEKF